MAGYELGMEVVHKVLEGGRGRGQAIRSLFTHHNEQFKSNDQDDQSKRIGYYKLALCRTQHPLASCWPHLEAEI